MLLSSFVFDLRPVNLILRVLNSASTPVKQLASNIKSRRHERRHWPTGHQRHCWQKIALKNERLWRNGLNFFRKSHAQLLFCGSNLWVSIKQSFNAKVQFILQCDTNRLHYSLVPWMFLLWIEPSSWRNFFLRISNPFTVIKLKVSVCANARSLKYAISFGSNSLR